MNFKKWLIEWEGFKFPGTSDAYVNSPAFPRSKYKGPGRGDTDDITKIPSGKVDDMYGFHKRKKKKKVKRTK